MDRHRDKTNRRIDIGRTALAAALAASLAGWPGLAGAASVFVNELHYDNAGADLDEFVEIAGPAGTDLTGWSIVLYNGASGAPYQSIALGGVIPAEATGFGALGFPVGGIQNGAPDGLALIDAAGAPRELLSYEGTFDAVAGAAAGLTSVDLLSAEPGTDAPGLSLQRIGAGRDGADFVWSPPALASFGRLNLGQVIAPAPVPLPPSVAGLAGALLGLVFLRRRRHARSSGCTGVARGPRMVFRASG